MNKLSICILISCLWLVITAPVKASELADNVQACSQIKADQARLTCFDQLTNNQKVIKKAQQTNQLTATQVDSFSKEHVKKTAEEKANEILTIASTISKLTKTSRGQWKITFANGQKWQQKDTIKMKLKEGDQVTLTKGALSSVFLKKENTNKRIKVKRLK